MSDIDGKQSTEITGNVKLLRDIPPKYDNPYEGTRSKWDSISAFKGSSIGSGVKTTGSSSTWKQKYTSY